jgi:hypothetical protein
LLSDQHAEQVPRTQLAWVLGRMGEAELVRQILLLVRDAPSAERGHWLAGFRDIAAQVDAPAPFLGAFGGEVARAPVNDLIDDIFPDIAADNSGRSFAMVAPTQSHPARGLGNAGVEPAPPARASFLFLLQGERARCDAMCAHSRARLEFRYEVPTADTLALAADPSLDEARQADSTSCLS